MSVEQEEGNPGRILIIKVKGIPPKATKTDILTFFHGLDVDVDDVHLKERRGAGEVSISKKFYEIKCCFSQSASPLSHSPALFNHSCRL